MEIFISDTFLSDLFISAVGSFIGIWGALWINKRQERSLRKKEKKENKKINNDILKHFILLMNSIIKTSKEQAESYNELSNKIKKEPLELHLPDIIANQDYQRIRNTNTKEILTALAKLNPTGTCRIENFQKIFSAFDYIDRKLSDIHLQNERHRNFTFDDQKYVRDIIDDLINILNSVSLDIYSKNPDNYKKNPVYELVSNGLDSCRTLFEKKATFALYETEFLIPFKENVLALLGNNPLGGLIFDKIRRALTRLQSIRENSLNFAEDCERIKSDLEKYITGLEKHINEIEKNVA